MRVSYEAGLSVEDVVFTVSFVWPSGYLCTELVSCSSTLVAGPGYVVFDCPVLAMQRGCIRSISRSRRPPVVFSPDACAPRHFAWIRVLSCKAISTCLTPASWSGIRA